VVVVDCGDVLFFGFGFDCCIGVGVEVDDCEYCDVLGEYLVSDGLYLVFVVLGVVDDCVDFGVFECFF